MARVSAKNNKVQVKRKTKPGVVKVHGAGTGEILRAVKPGGAIHIHRVGKVLHAQSARQKAMTAALLTKRMMVGRARAAGLAASSEAMKTMGYIVVAEGANLVRKHQNGVIEIIGAIH